MYESTPQHLIDEQSAPGPVAAWMDTSSSDDSSSSSSDSDNSNRSNTTAGRIKRVMRGGRRRRKSSFGSKESPELHSPIPTRTASYGTDEASPINEKSGDGPSTGAGFGHRFGAIDPADDADNEGAQAQLSRAQSINERPDRTSRKDRKHRKKRHEKEKKKKTIAPIVEQPSYSAVDDRYVPDPNDPNEPRRVDFAVTDLEAQVERKHFTIGGVHLRPAISKTFSQNVFMQPGRSGSPQIAAPTGPIPRVRYGIRRTNSLPDRLNQTIPGVPAARTPSMSLAPIMATQRSISEAINDDEEENISRTTAVILLLISTGLVALCAEFMVSSIDAVTQDTVLGETFVGLIILPIVGNAAEHVTAVTVANKNKMDLAIGVAVGSSIQIALFVTPFVVLLGWAMNVEMTLYFTLFETVSLFVSAFIVNFLVLDGRSNYLEGALLCAAYVIIAVAAFFYPSDACQSNLGGNPEAGSKLIRAVLNCT
jgi:Ca2+:H+ antiporter